MIRKIWLLVQNGPRSCRIGLGELTIPAQNRKIASKTVPYV